MKTETLKSEIAFYDSIKDRLIADGLAGKYALVGDGLLAGVWDTYEDALSAAYSSYGLEKRFLVKLIQNHGQAVHFTRDILPAAKLSVS